MKKPVNGIDQKNKPVTSLSEEEKRWEENLPRARKRLRTPKLTMSARNALDQDSKKSADENFLDLCETVSSGSTEFATLLIALLYRLNSTSTETVNAGLAFMRGLEPKDEAEALLISQMFATNLMAMRFAGRALHHEDPAPIDANVSRFNKLSKRYLEQLEALNKHRGKGQQKVTVEHVNVHSGGQAIVGNVEGGRGNEEPK